MTKQKNVRQIEVLREHIKRFEKKIEQGEDVEKSKKTIKALEKAVRKNKLEYDIWRLKQKRTMFRKVVKYKPLSFTPTELNFFRKKIDMFNEKIEDREEQLRQMKWKWT